MIQIKNSHASVWYCSDKVLLPPAFSNLFYECKGLAARDRTILWSTTNVASSQSYGSVDLCVRAIPWCHLSLFLVSPTQRPVLLHWDLSLCLTNPPPWSATEPRNNLGWNGVLKDIQLDPMLEAISNGSGRSWSFLAEFSMSPRIAIPPPQTTCWNL